VAEEIASPRAFDAAIKQDQLRLFYHPIVHLAGTSVIGHEVLIRWQHPERGLLSPSEFLPHIDANAGRSRELGTWILQQACEAAMQRGDQLHLSVNISPLHFSAPNFADHVTQILHVSGFSPARLILELTEASIRDADEAVVKTAKTLADVGITLALDDYGIGNENLARLDAIPIGMLKIDRTVTAGIGTDPEAEAFIVSTLELAAATGRRTITEGVENNEQARYLREHDATYAQGFLYGRPKPR
jgi:EAL domain-containing protein (putative c-di-GMP-specific phosphodiesterase class I)